MKKLEGVRNRIGDMEKTIETMESEVDSISIEINESEARLQQMETQAAKTMGSIGGSGLEDAVRMLMVAMHSCKDLPQNLAGATEAVSKCLPAPAVSEDAYEESQGMAVDGVGVGLKVEDVPAAVLDVAIPPDRIEPEVALEQLSHDDLLKWATSERKRARMTPY